MLRDARIKYHVLTEAYTTIAVFAIDNRKRGEGGDGEGEEEDRAGFSRGAFSASSRGSSAITR